MNGEIEQTVAHIDDLLPRAGADRFRIARVDEAACIGCTLCIQACPVDAIIGATRQMHTVIAAFCIGCELCLPVCPVDCIGMPLAGRAFSAEDARAARTRYRERNRRLALGRSEKSASGGSAADLVDLDPQQRQHHVAAARTRARARRARESARRPSD